MNDKREHVFSTPNSRFSIETVGNEIVKLQISGRESCEVITLDKIEIFDLTRELVRWCAMSLNGRFVQFTGGNRV
jgi:hypothetical protein